MGADESATLLACVLAAGAGTQAEPALSRLERVLTTYFTTLSEQVPFARVFFVESYTAGIPAQRKRVEARERFVDLMVGAFADSPEWRGQPDARFACRIVVGGISSPVSSALVKGEADPLRNSPHRGLAQVTAGVTTPQTRVVQR